MNTDQSVRNETINFNVNRFWDLETIGIREKEDSNLHDFQDLIYFNNEGRYEARLPFLGHCHYIAYHPVFREDKKTIKLRIVFDASPKENRPNLNEVLYKGPQLTPLIFDIHIRLRTYTIALTSDIEKAFHQVSVHEKDRIFEVFLV